MNNVVFKCCWLNWEYCSCKWVCATAWLLLCLQDSCHPVTSISEYSPSPSPTFELLLRPTNLIHPIRRHSNLWPILDVWNCVLLTYLLGSVWNGWWYCGGRSKWWDCFWFSHCKLSYWTKSQVSFLYCFQNVSVFFRYVFKKLPKLFRFITWNVRATDSIFCFGRVCIIYFKTCYLCVISIFIPVM